MEDHDGAELATQATLAKVEQRLTGTLKEQTEQGPFIGQHQLEQLLLQDVLGSHEM
jgi:hypothetical protein